MFKLSAMAVDIFPFNEVAMEESKLLKSTPLIFKVALTTGSSFFVGGLVTTGDGDGVGGAVGPLVGVPVGISVGVRVGGTEGKRVGKPVEGIVGDGVKPILAQKGS
jgi:hypothetical protein